MGDLTGQRVLVTGASGLMGLPLALALAAENEVLALARFTDATAKAQLGAAGVRTIVHDLGRDSLDLVPPDLDYVFHFGAMVPPASEQDRRATFEANAQAIGRLMSHCRRAKGFLHASSGSIYAYQGGRPMREDCPFGIHIGLYSWSKVVAESVIEFAAREYALPTTMIRICSAYSPRGGMNTTSRIHRLVAGEEILLHPDRPNLFNPLYETDWVEKAIQAVQVGGAPPVIMNFAGSETTSGEEVVAQAAELLGVEPRVRYTDEWIYPLHPDLTRMHELIGRTKVSPREGIRRVIEACYPDRLGGAAD